MGLISFSRLHNLTSVTRHFSALKTFINFDLEIWTFPFLVIVFTILLVICAALVKYVLLGSCANFMFPFEPERALPCGSPACPWSISHCRHLYPFPGLPPDTSAVLSALEEGWPGSQSGLWLWLSQCFIMVAFWLSQGIHTRALLRHYQACFEAIFLLYSFSFQFLSFP